MNWDHRLIDMSAKNDGEHWLEIKEVFYERKRPIGYTSALVGGEDADEVRQALVRMLAALDKPVLTLTKEGTLI
jgi:hypothetical protein